MKKLSAIGLSVFAAAVVSTVVVKEMNRIIFDKQTEKEKFRIMYQMMERWMRMKQRGDSLPAYFESHGYREVAVYGMGDIGKILVQELKGSTVHVKYGIDRNLSLTGEMEIMIPEEAEGKVDAVIVTAIAHFDEIYKTLSQKFSCPILSLEDIIYEAG